METNNSPSRAVAQSEGGTAQTSLSSLPSVKINSPSTLDTTRLLDATDRKLIVEKAKPLREAGLGWRDIGAELGVPYSNIVRWCALAEQGEENLIDQRHLSGRRSNWEEIAAIPEVRQWLQQTYLQTIGASSAYMTKARRTGSATLTLERFADYMLCPHTLSIQLRLGRQPKPLLNVIREITTDIEQSQRGAKHASLNAGLRARRNGLEVMEDGTEVKIVEGDYWVFDDMSTNFPFWFLNMDGAPEIGRQGLYCYDKTHRWLGHELVGTGRDSYTAAIILRFLRRLIQAIGLPRKGIVLEQSVWKARAIEGYRLTARGQWVLDEYDRPAIPSQDTSELEQGIKALGIRLHYAYSPRGKEIEGGFNYFQRVFATEAPRDAVNVGRHAGEFDAAAKQVRRAKAGSHHPQDLGFLQMDTHADLGDKTMLWINNHTVRQATGNPEAVAAPYPMGRALTEDHMAVFLPNKSETLIRGGKVTAIVNGVPYDFTAPAEFGALGEAYRVYVKFDAAEPSLGAAIYNRETGSGNFRGYKLGGLIAQADYLPPVNSFDWRDKASRGADPVAQARRAHAGAVRTAFRATGMPSVRASTARDGKGNVAEISATSTPSNASTPSTSSTEPTLRTRRAEAPSVGGTPEQVTRRNDLLAKQAALARRAMQEESTY